MNTLPPPVLNWIQGSLSKVASWGPKNPPEKIDALAGDGSTRQFYRVRNSTTSCILLLDPAWVSSRDYPQIQSFLKERGLPVPTFLDHSENLGTLLMEDLGDTLLQEAIQKDPSSKMKLLGSAVQLLASLHGSTYPVPRSLVVSTRTFDTEKYSTELLFTFDHLHAQFLGLSPLSPPEETKVISFCDYISKIQPLVFSHRDYHCRNLLAKNTSLYLIDFQDARMGPPHYDLASILYDAYCPLSEAERTKLIQLYQTALSTHPIAKDIDWSRFDTDLTAVAFQRVVKAAGSFASFYNRNKKPTHLPYLEPALTMAMYLREKLKPMDMLEFPIQQWLKKMNEKNLKERLW